MRDSILQLSDAAVSVAVQWLSALALFWATALRLKVPLLVWMRAAIGMVTQDTSLLHRSVHPPRPKFERELIGRRRLPMEAAYLLHIRYFSNHHQSGCNLRQSAWRCLFSPIKIPNRIQARLLRVCSQRLWSSAISVCLALCA
jgi:hypothetical protein